MQLPSVTVRGQDKQTTLSWRCTEVLGVSVSSSCKSASNTCTLDVHVHVLTLHTCKPVRVGNPGTKKMQSRMVKLCNPKPTSQCRWRQPHMRHDVARLLALLCVFSSSSSTIIVLVPIMQMITERTGRSKPGKGPWKGALGRQRRKNVPFLITTQIPRSLRCPS